mgnify:CR=1 FL=1
MEKMTCRSLVKLVAIVALLGSPVAALAASGKFEKTIAVDGSAVVHVNNESGAVTVKGADVEQVTIRARIRIDKSLASRDPSRAQKIIDSIRRAPPITAKGSKITITKVERRSYQKHASISYDILVPRDSDIEVSSVSGNVVVSGVTGEVNATSDSGKVTLADVASKDAAHRAPAS